MPVDPIGVSQAFHVNVNCSDLTRSLGFYRDLGLAVSTRTAPPAPQDGAAFGLDEVQWDARILNDHRGFGNGLAVDLLQWLVPRPTGRPAGATDLGMTCLGISVSDLDGTRARLDSHGSGASRPTLPEVDNRPGGDVARSVIVEDPDGMLVELVEGVEGEDVRVRSVSIGVSDLDRSRAFYTDVLGCRPGPERAAGSASTARVGSAGAARAASLDDPRGVCTLELIELPASTPRGGPSRAANRLGMFRLAFLTDDIDRAHADLVARGVACWSPPATLEMGPGIPPVRALCFDDPDGAVLELIEPPR